MDISEKERILDELEEILDAVPEGKHVQGIYWTPNKFSLRLMSNVNLDGEDRVLDETYEAPNGAVPASLLVPMLNQHANQRD